MMGIFKNSGSKQVRSEFCFLKEPSKCLHKALQEYKNEIELSSVRSAINNIHKNHRTYEFEETFRSPTVNTLKTGFTLQFNMKIKPDLLPDLFINLPYKSNIGNIPISCSSKY